jgi:hypothetical protein
VLGAPLIALCSGNLDLLAEENRLKLAYAAVEAIRHLEHERIALVVAKSNQGRSVRPFTD